jgi:Tfp pilus assembly protein FimT
MSRSRTAFTLVELLVVASLMAMLFGLVLSVGRGGGKSSARRAAQEFASMLLAAQSRALGKPEGAAVIVEAGGNEPRLGTVLHDGLGLPPVVGKLDDDGKLEQSPQLAEGYKLRYRMEAGKGFATISPWMAVRDGQGTLRTVVGQTDANTIDDPPAATEAIVVRYPVKGPKPTKLSKQVAVDLEHSGVGDDPAASHGHGRFEGQSPVAVVFDQTGRVAEVIQQVGAEGGPPIDPVVPTEPIYFLFAERSAIEGNTSLTSDKSVWVAVNPQTGRINVSSNEPSSTLATARQKARQGVAIGK